MVALIILCWWLCGTIGYFLIRQGFLVQYEKILGKSDTWNMFNVFLGIFSIIVLGPLFILVALLIQGKYCFKQRVKS